MIAKCLYLDSISTQKRKADAPKVIGASLSEPHINDACMYIFWPLFSKVFFWQIKYGLRDGFGLP